MNKRLQELGLKWLAGTITSEEKDEYMAWYNHEDNTPVVIPDELGLTELAHRERIFGIIAGRLDGKPYAGGIESNSGASGKVRSRFIGRWVAAASMVAIMGMMIAVVLFSNPRPVETQGDVVKKASPSNEIAPGREGAVLTLSDGRKIVLDGLGNGTVADENGTRIVLENNRLAYNATGRKAGSTEYNTMSTPKGRQFELVLPDGSRVWLNAASSITYPTVFDDAERRVTLTGEAYFEVEKIKGKPFRVATDNSTEIEVLGTRFNINSYLDEIFVKTTLLEGSVKLTSKYDHEGSISARSVVLKPGEQGQVPLSYKNKKHQPSIAIENADVEKVMAWKNGFFNFDDANLQEVMRQVARWYDIDVVYEKGVPDIYFVGEMSRNISLAGLLKGLEKARVHFRIEEGKRLVVLP